MRKNIFEINFKYILYIILWISLFQGFISDYIKFHQINYICDFLLIFLLVIKLSEKNLNINYYRKIEYISIITFIVVIILGWLFNSISIFQAMWGVRNYSRFFIFFIFACIIWGEKDIKKIENFFIKLFPFHIGIVIFQYLFEGLKQDNLSGLFGKVSGGNGGLVIYLLIIFCIVLGKFEYRKISLSSIIIYLFFILLNAALSELKIIFILTIFFIGVYFILCKDKKRGIILTLLFFLLLLVNIKIFYYLFPAFENYLAPENGLKVISDQRSYSSQEDIGRLTVFSKLTPILFQWGGMKALILGIGLGNGDCSSSYQIFNSSFYQVYEKIHYTWFSLGYLFVETGYLGVISYLSFFIILEIKAITSYLKNAVYYNYLGIFFPIIIIIIIIYNSTMRSNFAYIAYTVLTWQIIYSGKNKKYKS